MESNEFKEKMAEELGKWHELGANPEGLGFDGGMFGLSIRIELLFDILDEAGIMPREEQDRKYRAMCLERHRQLREEVVEPQVKKARQEALRAQIVPRMDIPRGNHKGH